MVLINNLITYKDFIKLLDDNSYKPTTQVFEYMPMFERLSDYGVTGVFDSLNKELNRVPSMSEFTTEGIKRAKKFFTDKERKLWDHEERKHYYFSWNEQLEKVVEGRLQRTYKSYLIEEQVKLFLESEYDVKLYHNRHLDLKFGVDIVINKDNKLYYIHIAMNTNRNKSIIKDKGKRKPYVEIHGKRYLWERNWGKAHHLLLFNTTAGDRMIEINDNLIFDDEYLKRYFDKLFEVAYYEVLDKNSEFVLFNRWLKIMEKIYREGLPDDAMD